MIMSDKAIETTPNMHHDDIKAAIALQAGITLYQRYSEVEAAKFLEMSVPTLKRRRSAGQISYLKTGSRKISYYGFQLVEYLLDSIEGKQEQTKWQSTETTIRDTKSATTGLASKQEAPLGAERGSTPNLTRQDALASARRILQKPNKP